MNDRNQITGMIAVFDNAALNARFDYEIDLAKNKVAYTVTCHWKPNGVFGKCQFRKFAEAKMLFDGLPGIAENELTQRLTTAIPK